MDTILNIIKNDDLKQFKKYMNQNGKDYLFNSGDYLKLYCDKFILNMTLIGTDVLSTALIYKSNNIAEFLINSYSRSFLNKRSISSKVINSLAYNGNIEFFDILKDKMDFSITIYKDILEHTIIYNNIDLFKHILEIKKFEKYDMDYIYSNIIKYTNDLDSFKNFVDNIDSPFILQSYINLSIDKYSYIKEKNSNEIKLENILPYCENSLCRYIIKNDIIIEAYKNPYIITETLSYFDNNYISINNLISFIEILEDSDFKDYTFNNVDNMKIFKNIIKKIVIFNEYNISISKKFITKLFKIVDNENKDTILKILLDIGNKISFGEGITRYKSLLHTIMQNGALLDNINDVYLQNPKTSISIKLNVLSNYIFNFKNKNGLTEYLKQCHNSMFTLDEHIESNFIIPILKDNLDYIDFDTMFLSQRRLDSYLKKINKLENYIKLFIYNNLLKKYNHDPYIIKKAKEAFNNIKLESLNDKEKYLFLKTIKNNEPLYITNNKNDFYKINLVNNYLKLKDTLMLLDKNIVKDITR